MKKLLFISILMITFANLKAQSCFSGSDQRVFLVNTSAGTTDKGEFVTSLEVSTFKARPSWFVSLVGEVYNSKSVDYQGTTAHVGVRLNKTFLRDVDNYRLIAFTGGKYATQGSGKENGFNKWIAEGGVGFMRKLGDLPNADGWIRANVLYNSVPGNQVMFTLGFQIHF